MKSIYLILALGCSVYAGELRTIDSPQVKVRVIEFTLDLDEQDNKNVTQNIKKNTGDDFSFIEKKSGDDFEAKVNKYNTNEFTPEFSYKKENK
jgi:hypothetical protein